MNFLDKVSIYIISRQGMKKNLLVFLFGVLVTCALPPLYIWPLAIIGFSGFFVMLISCANSKHAFKIGWWFGFGHFVSGLYWIAFALLVDFASFGWLIPFAVFGIPSVIAVYIAVVSVITWQLGRFIKSWKLVIAFSCIWTIIEMIRGWLFTGFPWNLAGYVWAVSNNMLQFSSVSGIWGLSLVTVLAFTMPAILLMGDKCACVRSLHNKVTPIVFSALLLIAIFVWGGARLANSPEQFVPGIKMRIVQANIPQNMKWDEEWRYETVSKYLEMSRISGFEDITHIIWPETALPFTISKNSELLHVISQVVPKGGAIITGALRAEYNDNGFLKNMWNSLIVLSGDGKIYSHYDKSHLVPFGEYVPFRNILPLEKITHGSVDFSRGEGPKTINVPGFPDIGGVVCYEVIFSGSVVEKKYHPAVLVNVTNDAWYGNTSGPYQHFQMARVRAIEEGIPLVRAANNGISAVVDAYGRVIGSTDLGVEAVIDLPLPKKIPVTTYGRYGKVVVILLMGSALLIVCINSLIRKD
jgi:apolipoprotein N-acyltransferase